MVAAAVGITVGLSLVADRIGVYPFGWRSEGAVPIIEIAALRRSGGWIALMGSTLVSVLVRPLLEEVTFRIGALRAIAERTNSVRAGVCGSAILFSLAHLGPQFHLARAEVGSVVRLFMVGVVLGVLTVFRTGRIAMAYWVHAARNLTEIGMLLLASNG